MANLSITDNCRFTQLALQSLRISLFNLLLVACLGLLLRAVPFLEALPFSYKNILHGHSHFAFGGWVLPMLLLLLQTYFKNLAFLIGYASLRLLYALLFASAYGMLFSFPVQGYGPVSIVFSTLSVGTTFYMAFLFWRALRQAPPSVAHQFLTWGLFYLCLSAIGPFATGPLIVLGYAGSPLYYNAIYFYLHFQYNGWFTFALLAVIYSIVDKGGATHRGKLVFLLINAACIPSYALSVLWSKPPAVLYFIGATAAVVQLAGLYFFVKDVWKTRWSTKAAQVVFRVAVLAFAFKMVLQLISAHPTVAQLAFQQRNFVIAYLHLVLLGFVSSAAVVLCLQQSLLRINNLFRAGGWLFICSFFTTEGLLVMQALSNEGYFSLPHVTSTIFWRSVPFPLGVAMMWVSTMQKQKVLLPFAPVFGYKLFKPLWAKSR